MPIRDDDQSINEIKVNRKIFDKAVCHNMFLSILAIDDNK